MTDMKNAIPQVPAAEVPEGVQIIDVREPNERAAGHAVGSTWIPMGEIRDRMDEIGGADGDPIYVMCKSGGRSQKVAEHLAQQGRQVINVAGGTTAWMESGRPMASDTGDEPQVVAATTQPPNQV